MAKTEIPITLAAVAHPGDTILIGFDRSLTDEELDDLREGFQGFTDSTGVHIAFVEHATSMVVASPADECPYTHAHTREWCGHSGCRES